MRDFLFRGKIKGSGAWIEGNLVNVKWWLDGSPITVIIPTDAYLDPRSGQGTIRYIEVIPETIGQWTGLTDADGKKIFEGDIVSTRKDSVRTEKLKGYFGYDSDGYPQKVPGYEESSEYHYPCVVDCFAEVVFTPCGGFYLRGANRAVNAICNKVVGNIHDNPELLKGE